MSAIDIKELEIVLENIFKESTSQILWGNILDIFTLLLSAVSVLIAYFVYTVYKQQSSILKEHKEINEEQLKLSKVELIKKRYELVPNFILHSVVEKQKNSNSTYILNSIKLRISRHSPVRELRECKVEIRGKEFFLKSNFNSDEFEYNYNSREEFQISNDFIDSPQRIELVLKIMTVGHDKFEKRYSIELNDYGNFNNDVTNVIKELKYIDENLEEAEK